MWMLRSGDDLLEDLRLIGCDAGEHLAIKLDVGGLELCDELGVGEATFAGCCVDANGPEATHRSLFFLAISKLE